MQDDIILYYDFEENHVTVKNYNEFVKNKDKDKLAEFVYNRLYSRYVKPFEFEDKKYKNGFSMMASFCLLIETLQSFKEGLGDSNGKSGELFQQFFNEEANFKEFKKTLFYKHVRCGILHQGETTGGWKINRKPNTPLVNDKDINANKFMKELKKSLKKYGSDLKAAEWDSEIWDNFRTKMRKIIKNTEG